MQALHQGHETLLALSVSSIIPAQPVLTCKARISLAIKGISLPLSGCSKISQVPPIKTQVGSLNPKRPWSTTRKREIFYGTVSVFIKSVL
jgi:hypothetical protein